MTWPSACKNINTKPGISDLLSRKRRRKLFCGALLPHEFEYAVPNRRTKAFMRYRAPIQPALVPISGVQSIRVLYAPSRPSWSAAIA